jgi:hypothetical protein
MVLVAATALGIGGYRFFGTSPRQRDLPVRLAPCLASWRAPGPEFLVYPVDKRTLEAPRRLAGMVEQSRGISLDGQFYCFLLDAIHVNGKSPV